MATQFSMRSKDNPVKTFYQCRHEGPFPETWMTGWGKLHRGYRYHISRDSFSSGSVDLGIHYTGREQAAPM